MGEDEAGEGANGKSPLFSRPRLGTGTLSTTHNIFGRCQGKPQNVPSTHGDEADESEGSKFKGIGREKIKYFYHLFHPKCLLKSIPKLGSVYKLQIIFHKTLSL